MQAYVQQTLESELRAAQDTSHPMRYELFKSSPRYSSTKYIYETRDGAVARLVAVNGLPLSPAEEQKEQTRLNTLLADPSRQRHRQEAETQDAARALNVLRALPHAFLFQDAGPAPASHGQIERFSFKPNPVYQPPDMETQVLTGMTGQLWIDTAHQRVVRLEGSLQRDVNFGWGLLGRLNKGGWVSIEQSEVSGGCWRIVRLRMSMTGRVFFKTKVFDTMQEESDFRPLPVGLNYMEAIKMMRNDGSSQASASR